MMIEILNIAIGSITIGGVLVFLGKHVIDNGFKAAVKSYENKLEIIQHEHQVMFSKLHEERGFILKEIYSSLYDIEFDLKNLTSLFERPDLDEDNSLLLIAKNQIMKSRTFFEKNRIFLTTEFCDLLDENLKECYDIVSKMNKATIIAHHKKKKGQNRNSISLENEESQYSIWMEQEKKVRGDISRRRIELADSFREIFGIKTNN
jgi:hypothetical protein